MRAPFIALLFVALAGATYYGLSTEAKPELVRLSERSSDWVTVLHSARGRLVSEAAVMRRSAEVAPAGSSDSGAPAAEASISAITAFASDAGLASVELLGEPTAEQRRYIESIAEGLLDSRGERFAKIQQQPLDDSPWRAFQELRASHMLVEAAAVNDALANNSFFLVAGGLTPPSSDDATMVTMTLRDEQHGTATCCVVLPFEKYPTLEASALAVAESRRALGVSLRYAVNTRPEAERRELLLQAAHAPLHQQIREARIRIDSDTWTLL